MPVNPRNIDFIGYMESRRKKKKYLMDYLAEIILWFTNKIHFIYSRTLIAFLTIMIKIILKS